MKSNEGQYDSVQSLGSELQASKDDPDTPNFNTLLVSRIYSREISKNALSGAFIARFRTTSKVERFMLNVDTVSGTVQVLDIRF